MPAARERKKLRDGNIGFTFGLRKMGCSAIRPMSRSHRARSLGVVA
jgi:hypothetical protein